MESWFLILVGGIAAGGLVVGLIFLIAMLRKPMTPVACRSEHDAKCIQQWKEGL